MAEDRGMVPREKWTESAIHKASRYACGKCGARFATPHDFYAHLDEKHPKKETRHGRRR